MPITIPHAAAVLVADGRKAILFKNEGDALHPNLRPTRQFDAPPNPPTHLQGTERPGRTLTSSGRRSAMATTDWHVLAERGFARSVAEAVDTARERGEFSALVVVAPPKTLAALRSAFADETKQITLAEVAKDLTKHPAHVIGSLLTGNVH
jgi:protein required for attachment to host cells